MAGLSRGKLVTIGVGAAVAAVLTVLGHNALQPYRGDLKFTPARRSLGVETRTGGSRDLGKPPGKLLVLHFWATWCPPCVEEMPGLLAFARETKSDPSIELLAVSVDDDWKTVEEWLKAHGASDLPLALDPKRAVASRMGTDKFPETYIISPTGVKLAYVKGPVDWTSREVRQQIEDLKRSSAAPAAAAPTSS
jgi:thiol-disulfide isomerase/thioredoxin